STPFFQREAIWESNFHLCIKNADQLSRFSLHVWVRETSPIRNHTKKCE
ncbi:putative Protein kinase C protein, partial [Naja naja]